MKSHDDEYPTCARTYATFCVYLAGEDLGLVSRVLGIEPTRTTGPSRARPDIRAGWYLTTEGVVRSRDLRRHLDWLAARLEPLGPQIEELRRSGARTGIFCFWASAYGHGGPAISVTQMRILAELGLDLDLDVYFPDGMTARR